MITPRVSVILPLYNAENYIEESLKTILNQTFKDFEILVLNDGSKDQSAKVVEQFIQKNPDPRLKFLQNPQNIGLSATLNRGMELAQGEYLARMDQDDLCEPTRLEKQVQYLDLHPQIDILGTAYTLFGAKLRRTVYNPETDEAIKAALFFDTGFGHPTVMMRKSSMLKNKLFYDPAYHNAEDYDLWTRAFPHLKFANLSESLLKYRIHSTQMSASRKAQKNLALQSRKALLDKLGVTLTATQSEVHEQIAQYSFANLDDQKLQEIADWKSAITTQLQKNHPHLLSAFTHELKIRFTRSYYFYYFDWNIKRHLLKTDLVDFNSIVFREKFVFFLKGLYRKIKGK